jgi:hypothetical protein
LDERKVPVQAPRVWQGLAHYPIPQRCYVLLAPPRPAPSVRNNQPNYRKNFVKVANAKDIAKFEEGVAQIVNYHGDSDDDNSLLLAETDYWGIAALTSQHDDPQRGLRQFLEELKIAVEE